MSPGQKILLLGHILMYPGAHISPRWGPPAGRGHPQLQPQSSPRLGQLQLQSQVMLLLLFTVKGSIVDVIGIVVLVVVDVVDVVEDVAELLPFFTVIVIVTVCCLLFAQIGFQ